MLQIQRFHPVLVGALALLVFSLGLRAADEKILAAVRAADDARVAATIAGDRVRLEAIYSDDLQYTHSSGKSDNKSVHLEGIAKRANAYEKFDYLTRDFRVAAPGIVLMSGHVIIHSTNAKGKHQNDVNFLSVWREEQGRWRLLSWLAAKNMSAEPEKK